MAVVKGGQVAVTGLREAVTGLGKVDKALPKAALLANRHTAKDVVKPSAHANMKRQPIPKQRAAITHAASRTTATIKLRTSVKPWAAGGEFGSLAFRQFRGWVGNQWTLGSMARSGYMIAPAIAENLREIDDTYADTLLKMLDDIIEQRRST